MGGGLIQLITTGIQDSPIIGNPEVTFFKTVYRQYTMFSLCQNNRYIGNLNFGKNGHKILEKNGDLLYNQCFKLDIPYFEIIKSYNNTEVLQSEYNINELSITYMNQNCIVFNLNTSWYIIPEKLFKLGNFQAMLTNIEAGLVEPLFLPDYINLSNLGNNVYHYNIADSNMSSVITLLRVESNYWEQFWLNFLSNTKEDILLNSLQTLKNNYNNLYQTLRTRIFFLFYSINCNYKNINYFVDRIQSNDVDEGNIIILKTEMERYFEYINDLSSAIKTYDNYEIDVVYRYCITNFKNFDDYKTDCLKYTPLVILLMFKMLYSDNKSIYTFWKQYTVTDNNDINNNITINNVNSPIEWENNINDLIYETLNKQNIKNIILDELINKYYNIESYIANLFNNLQFKNSKDIYIKLKTYMSRFHSVPNNQLNFNDYYKPYYYNDTKTNNEKYYNNDSYIQQLIVETNKYPQLNKINIDTTNEMNNLTPVNLENIYGIIAEDILKILITLDTIDNSIKSFIIFWRNLVVDRLYKKFIDIYQRIQSNPDFINSDTRKLSYYFTFNPGNIISSTEIRNSWLEMFYKNSFIGNISIGNNAFIKFKENLYNVSSININALNDINTTINDNKDFNKLQIKNTYTYIYNSTATLTSVKNDINKIIYDPISLKLIIRYDNYYDTKSIITLTNTMTNTSILFKSINYEIRLNELNFNSIYLVFSLNSSYTFLANDIITLNVTYLNYIPLVSFYNNTITQPKIDSTKYMLLSKNSNNQLNLFNIVKANTLFNTTQNDNILIDTKIDISNNPLILLTINYLNSSLIVKPSKCICTLSDPSTYEKFIPKGTYLYAISYYSLIGESDISPITNQLVQNTGQVIIVTLPISDNENIIGRKIYRTKANSTEFLLLAKIENNINTNFIDNIQDDELGIEYISGGNIKLNKLPNLLTNITKTLVTLIQDSDTKLYYMKDTNGIAVTLPIVYNNINEIYLEIFDYRYTINNNFTSISNSTITLKNESIDYNYLYYLINPNNFKDNIKLVPSYKPFTLSSLYLCNNIQPTPSSENIKGLLTIGTYYYKISLYNTVTLVETEAIEQPHEYTLSNEYSSMKLSNFYEIKNKQYNSFRIYRTIANDTNTNKQYYLLDTLVSIYNNIYYDITSDAALKNKYIEPFFYITSFIDSFNLVNYSILKIPINNVAPNLYDFISHSTDYEYINNKNLSDLNDFVFNKPLLMLVNNTTPIKTCQFKSQFDHDNSFNTESLYFYNINFKINNTSIITINDMIINYMMPISTQQFFIKSPNIPYYTLNTNTNINTNINDYTVYPVIDNNLLQMTFNPSFDEFNTPINILNKYFYPTLIDNLIEVYDKVIDNIDYKTTINLIDSINNNYITTIVNLLTINSNNPIYGFLSYWKIVYVSNINKYLNLFKYSSYQYNTAGQLYPNTTNLIPFIQNDFMWYQYNNLRLTDYDITYEKKSLSTLTFINKSNIMILSPIYKSYLSRYRISDNMILFFNNLLDFYTKQYTYINDNIDFLNLSNPNSIKNEYLSISEINQNITNNYYNYSDSTIITTLHPIIDTNIYKINIVDQQNNIKQINNFSIDLSNYKIATLDYIDNKSEDNFINSELLITNTIIQKTDKFNYWGITNINLDNNNQRSIIFNDYYANINSDTMYRYFKFDDGIIYTGVLDSVLKRYKFTNILSDCLIVNPIELTDFTFITDVSTITFNPLQQITHIYIINLILDSTITESPFSIKFTTQFLIDGQIIDGIIIKVDTLYELHLYSNNILNLTFKKLIYLTVPEDLTTWNVLPVTNIYIKTYKKANFITNNNISINPDDIFTIDKISANPVPTFYNYMDILIDPLKGQSYIYNDTISGNNITLYIYKNKLSTDININNYVTHTLLPSMSLKRIEYNIDTNYTCYAYSNFINNDYTKILLDTPETKYVLFVNLALNRHYMLQKKNILSYEIPIGNYHTWILPQSTLNLIPFPCNYTIDLNGNISGLNNIDLPEYCYYMVKNNNYECIYYYEKGNMINININEKITYYENVASITYNTIYLIDNTLFNTNNKQLIKSYNKNNSGNENYISKNISNSHSNFNFDTIENVSFKSNYSYEIFDISSFNANVINANGTNEIQTELILQSITDTNTSIYIPIIINKYVNNNVPYISNSYIPLQIDSMGNITSSTSYNKTINNSNSNLIFTSLSPYISVIFDNVNINITINEDNINTMLSSYISVIFDNVNINITINEDNINTMLINQQILCKIQVYDTSNNQNYQIYIWLLLTNNSIIYDNYTVQIPQPLYTDINGKIDTYAISLDGFTLLNDNIFKQDYYNILGNILVLNDLQICNEISYKYYCDTRNINVDDNIHEIKQLNYNSLLNIKPITLSYLISTSSISRPINSQLQTLHDTASFFILTSIDYITQKKVHNIIQHRTGNNNLNTTNSFTALSTVANKLDLNTSTNYTLSAYISLQNPYFVKNKICLVPINSFLYKITNYDKLYLEQDEIICINLNYFYVKGLNHFDDTYELEPIRYETECGLNITNFGDNLTFTNNGYYTFGVYSTKNNKELPNFNKQNIMTFNTNQDLAIGDIYKAEDKLYISNSTLSTNNPPFLYSKFTESSLRIKLLHYNKRFYLFDNFVKLKIWDKIVLVYDTNVLPIIFTICNIRDNEIIFKHIDNLHSLDDNKFYDFILPYQPFDAKYININNNIISDNTIKNNTTLLIQSTNNSFDIYNVIDRQIKNYTRSEPIYESISESISEPIWVLVWDTNYTANFNNSMVIPNNFNTIKYKLNNNHPISINVTYDSNNKRFIINDFTSFKNTFTWFYNQPVKVFSTYNFIQKIEHNNQSNIYYLYLTIPLPSTINNNDSTLMIISPSGIIDTTLFYLNKFRYNYGIQLPNYDKMSNTSIEVIRCALKNDQLVFIEKIRNTKPIIFKYGVSISQNETDNKIDSTIYTNIYFYNYRMLNPDGTINNFDTLIGTYYLLCETNNTDLQRIHLLKIKDGNKIKMYTNPLVLSKYLYTISKLVSIKINVNGNFIYDDNQIAQVTKIPNNYTQPIDIIKQYFINFNGIIRYDTTTNIYSQDIVFTNITNKIDTDIYNHVYIDSNLSKTYSIQFNTDKYTLYSDTYINNINIIYTKNTNYLVSSLQKTKTIDSQKKLSDNTLNFYIDTKILNTEQIVQNILISKISSEKPVYKYKLIDNSNLILESTVDYKVQDLFITVTDFDNNSNTITTVNFIDNDTIEINSDYYKVNFFTNYTIDDLSNFINTSQLFTDVKQLRQQLFLNSFIDDNTIYNYLKPWKTWSILSSANTTTALKSLINNVVIKYVSLDITSLIVPSNLQFSYLTNNEVNILQQFILAINKNPIYMTNYKNMRIIEPKIISQISNWISQPDFFLNVTENINTFLKTFKNPQAIDVFFDGNNIIFNNDLSPPLITIDGEQEILYYLSNEYTYSESNNYVYRTTNSYNQISSHINMWVNSNMGTSNILLDNKNLGVRICKLLRYLRILGDNLLELFNNLTKPLTETPDFFYNSPIKFLLEKIWENYSNKDNFINLDKDFSDNITVVTNFDNYSYNNIYSYVQFNANINITYYGLINYTNSIVSRGTIPINDVNIDYASQIQPYGESIINVKNILQINPIYKYKLNVDINEIYENSTYILDFLSGDKISSIVNISNIELFPGQINFDSDYNIKPTDFFVLVQQTVYNIVSAKNLGYLYNIQFNNITSDKFKLIQNIYYKRLNVTIYNFDNSTCIFTLLLPVSQITINDIFEIRNENIITKIEQDASINTKWNIVFNNEPFYIVNLTYIEINHIKYVLQYDTIKKTYYIQTQTLIQSNILYVKIYLITQISPSTSTSTSLIGIQQLIEFTLNPPFNDISYIKNNSNFITAFDFTITSSTTSSYSLNPVYIDSHGNNKLVFYFNTSTDVSFSLNPLSYNIIHKKRINQNICNEILSLTSYNEYLYYIENTFPTCSHTIGSVYDSVNLINNGLIDITKLTFNNIYFNQLNNNTYFTTNINYTLDNLKTYGFCQQNKWILDLNMYTINNNILSIIIPSDFVFLIESNVYYIIGSIPINKNDFSIINNNLTISLDLYPTLTITGTINLFQNFVSDIGLIFKPKLNRKYTAQLGYANQYSQSFNFYYMPYSSIAQKFDAILYKIEISNLQKDNGFAQNMNVTSLTLICNNSRIVAKILDTYYSSSKEYYIISLPNKINLSDQNLKYSYYTNNTFDIKPIISIEYYQDMLQFAQYYKQTSSDSIDLFMNDSVNEYIISSPSQTKNDASKFYLIDYNKTSLTNLFYNNTFVQNTNMQRQSYISNTQTQEIIKPIWRDYKTFFSKISMYFNDQLIEELNENIFNIDYHLYSTEEKRKQKDNMCKVRFTDNKWELYIPLIFWYSCKGGLSIPTVAMPYTEIRLEYTLNDLTHILENDLTNINYQLTKIPPIKLSLSTDYVLLDTKERHLFGTYSHEYIIDRYKIYSDVVVTDINTVLHKDFNGLIKDIHMISRPINNLNTTYYQNIQTKYDIKYKYYITAYQYYLELIVSNVYTSNEQKKYAIDIEIIRNISIQLSNYLASNNKTSSNYQQINRIINTYSSWAIWDSTNNLLKYLLYFENKYLSKLSDSKRENVLTIYLKYQFSNSVIINEISPIKSLLIKANGADLFSEQDCIYFTDVVPCHKFKNSLPTGYYTYTFSLYPLDDQHSGHLNFTNFDDIVIKVTSDAIVNLKPSNPYVLSTVVREYNILRIMSGLSSLGWM